MKLAHENLRVQMDMLQQFYPARSTEQRSWTQDSDDPDPDTGPPSPPLTPISTLSSLLPTSIIPVDHRRIPTQAEIATTLPQLAAISDLTSKFTSSCRFLVLLVCSKKFIGWDIQQISSTPSLITRSICTGHAKDHSHARAFTVVHSLSLSDEVLVLASQRCGNKVLVIPHSPEKQEPYTVTIPKCDAVLRVEFSPDGADLLVLTRDGSNFGVILVPNRFLRSESVSINEGDVCSITWGDSLKRQPVLAAFSPQSNYIAIATLKGANGCVLIHRIHKQNGDKWERLEPLEIPIQDTAKSTLRPTCRITSLIMYFPFRRSLIL
jgi:hypothetical protein